jgi:putative tryptophan/tyrosine transport system substrate-binding protein
MMKAVSASSWRAAGAASRLTPPTIFGTGGDPVKDGLVASLNRPGGNITGITYMNVDLVAKRIGLLNELRPTAAQFVALIDPRISTITPTVVEELHAAVSNIDRRIEVIPASTSGEIDAAFSSLLEKRSDVLVVPPFPFFSIVAYRYLRWQPAMAYRRSIPRESGPRPVGS